MIPCKFCMPGRRAGVVLKGLKQVGKTKYDGPRYVRRYRCQDCGATCTLRGELGPSSNDEWSQPN